MSNFSEEFNKNRSVMEELIEKRDRNQEGIDRVEKRLDELYDNSENRTKEDEAEFLSLSVERERLFEEDLRLGGEILICLKEEIRLLNS